MNIPLLEQAKNAILDEPSRLGMAEYFAPSSTSPCGTTACIAGHVIMVDRLREDKKTFRNKKHIKSIKWFSEYGMTSGRHAKDLLDLTEGERFKLFHVVNWPEQYRVKYENARSAESRARITAKRIDCFIATDGRE